MRKLIQFEFKKIFKSKMNVFLIIGVFIACFYIMYFQAMNYIGVQNIKDFEGNDLNPVEVYRFIDEFQHAHAHEVTDEYVKEMESLYQKIVDENRFDEFDDQKMREYYGPDYLELVEKIDSNTLNDDEYHQFMENFENERLIFKKEDGTYYIEKYYVGTEREYLLNRCIEMDYLRFLRDKDELIITREVVENIQENPEFQYFLSDGMNEMEGLEDKHIDYLNKEIQEKSTYFDSTVGATMLYRLTLYDNIIYVYYLLILLIIVLCSNLFSQEKNVNSILVPTKKGYNQMVIAKLMSACIIAIGVLTIYYIGVLLFVHSIVPIRNLDVLSPYIVINKWSIYTLKEVFILGWGQMMCAVSAVAILSSFLSCITDSRFISSIVLLIINFIPLVTGNLVSTGKLSILDFIPTKMTYVMNLNYFDWYSYIGNIRKIQLYELNQMFFTKTHIVVFTWILICLMLVGTCYFVKRRHVIK